jgi:hypothetical protein
MYSRDTNHTERKMKFGFMLVLCCFLAACGGETPAKPDDVVAKPVAPVPVTTPVAQVPAVASQPDAPAVAAPADPVAQEPIPASAPVVASSPAPASEPVIVPPVVIAPKTVLIETYGDDAMLGMTSQTMVTQQSEPADTQTLLKAQFPGVTVVNHASGGTSSTLVNEMAGVDGMGAPFAQRIMASKADIVLDNHAVNDDLSQSLAPYSDALVAWITAVRAAGKVPVLEEPNPVCDGNHPYLENYVSSMDNIAAQYNVPVVAQYAYLQTIPNYCSHLSAGLYPDASIYALKAQRQAAALAPIVQKLTN